MKGRERAELRAEAHHLDPTVHVGQHGLTPALISSLDDALRTRELVKVKLGKKDEVKPKDLANSLAVATNSAVVQVIGRTATLFRENPEIEKSAAISRPGANSSGTNGGTGMGAAIAAAAMRRREQEVIDDFRAAGATSPERAQSYTALGFGETLAVRRLRNRAVIREAGPGVYYLDEEVWAAVRRTRHRLLAVFVAMLAALLTGVLLGVIRP